jgi:hypothetical protein
MSRGPGGPGGSSLSQGARASKHVPKPRCRAPLPPCLECRCLHSYQSESGAGAGRRCLHSYQSESYTHISVLMGSDDWERDQDLAEANNRHLTTGRDKQQAASAYLVFKARGGWTQRRLPDSTLPDAARRSLSG